MQRQVFIFFIQFILLYNKYNFTYSKALIGYNIRSVNENEFPSVVCIVYYNPLYEINRSLICSGVLISGSHILTAEHCFEDLEENILQVLIGPGDFARSVPYYPIWWISFDQWALTAQMAVNQEFYNDLAIIKLFGIPPNIDPALISRITPISLLYGMNVDVIGCGITNTGTISTDIQIASLKMIRNNDCHSLVSALESTDIPVPDNYKCTVGHPYTFLEHGDSGGPVFFFGNVVGIHSGVVPKMQGQFHAMKVNIHVSLDYCREFIDALLNV